MLPFWSTGGNANTSPFSEFIGTSDDEPLVFKTNGSEVMRMNPDGSVGIGVEDPWDTSILHIKGNNRNPELLVEETNPGSAAYFGLRSRSRTWYMIGDSDPDVFAIFAVPPGGGANTALTIRGSNRNVGIGTNAPTTPLHVRNGTAFAELTVEETRAGAAVQLDLKNTNRFWRLESDADPDRFKIIGADGPARITILGGSGNVGIGLTAQEPAHPLQMASGAYVTAGGVWTDASSRAYKENIRELSAADALSAFSGLTPVQFTYKADQGDEHLGFIAEDVPALVATPDRKGLSPMDIIAVLTKVVQQQEQRITDLEARFDALRADHR
jgi:hypothetical protein